MNANKTGNDKNGIGAIRAAYAKQVVATAKVSDNRAVETAFATVKRERFLGREPWLMFEFGREAVHLPSNDPQYAYQDALFALDPKRGVNNGVPSLHALFLNALDVKTGMTVAHMGAGTGYYSAILAHLVGPSGKIIAIEFDNELGRKAQNNLQCYANVELIIGDAAKYPRKTVDRIYVNYALSAPPENWITMLKMNARLVMPLGVPDQTTDKSQSKFSSIGGGFVFAREETGYSASHICPASFIYAEGDSRSASRESEAALEKAFKSPGVESVQSLIWKRSADPSRCWFYSGQWSLSYDPL